MKMNRIPVCLLFAWITLNPSARQPQVHSANPQQPPQAQLRRVLELETNGRTPTVDRRGALNPASNPAAASPAEWWQAGFVKSGEVWSAAEDSFDSAASSVLNEYRALREETPKTTAGQWKLANWCRNRKLPEQERAHLTQILMLSENGGERISIYKRLGYRQVGENWVSPAEYRDLLDQSRRTAEQLRQWQPRMERIARNWAASPKQRKLAQDELNGIKDATAIPALLIAARSGEEFALAITDCLQGIPSFESSQALATIAVDSEWPSVRESATTTLKERRIDDFAPALLGTMRGLFTQAKPTNGTIEPRLIFREEANRFVAIDVKLVPIVQWDVIFIRLNRTQLPFSRKEIAGRNLTDAQRTIADVDHRLQQQVEAENDNAEEFNQRSGAVLAELTGQQPSSNPNYWWAWWNLYTGTQPVPKKCEIVYREVPLQMKSQMIVGMRTCSCLIAGTPILTDRGFVAVDEIQVGDRVLSKDPQSGEIAHKPVLHTTARTPVPVKNFVVGQTSVVASEGHHFWVSGHGWSKTRELTQGQPLHTATGMSRIESVKDEPQLAPVYNLVVADFHTYFIGPAMILSHDVVQPAPTNAKVPGLEPEL